MKLSAIEFEAYVPKESPAGSLMWEYSELGETDPKNVWSLIDCGTGKLYAVPGFHVVNVVGYTVTAQPWESADIEAVFSVHPQGEPVDGEPSWDPDHFEVSRVHTWTDVTNSNNWEKCSSEGCSEEHLFSVYVREPEDGRAHWLSDHTSELLAELAAAAYEPSFEDILAEHT